MRVKSGHKVLASPVRMRLAISPTTPRPTLPAKVSFRGELKRAGWDDACLARILALF